jgi:hypothetical protein
MKIIIINACLLLFATYLAAQAGVQISSGVHLVCSGEVEVVLNDMNWENEGSFSAGESTLRFIGGLPAYGHFQDALFNAYHHVSVRRPGSELTLQSDLDLEGDFTFLSGRLNLHNQALTLLEADSKLEQESSLHHTFGPTGGQLIAGAVLTFPEGDNPGKLGARFTAGGDLSYTEVRRGHGLYFTPGGHSISRWYSIHSALGAGVPTVLRLDYFDHELNGLAEHQLQAWNSTDYGLSWTPVAVTARNTTHNWVEIYGEGLSGLFTLSMPTDGSAPAGGASGQAQSVPASAAMQDLSVYPNPAVDFVQVVVKADEEARVYMQWLDAAGKLIQQSETVLYKGENIFNQNIGHFAAGTYFLKIQGQQFKAFPIVKLP